MPKQAGAEDEKKAAEQTDAGSDTGGHAGLAKAYAVEREGDGGGEQGERRGDDERSDDGEKRRNHGGDADHALPDDGGGVGLRSWRGRLVSGMASWPRKALRCCSAWATRSSERRTWGAPQVPAEDEGALVFDVEDGLAARAEGLVH